MKKLLFLTAAAAVAFSSCTKDQTEVVSIESKDGVRISASMVESTRTFLGEDNLYRWSKGDALGVFVHTGKNNAEVNNAKNVAFTLDPIYDGQVNGEFVSNNTDLLDAENEKFFAYYPHTPGMTATKVTDLNLQILPEQNYQPGSFATLTAPSVSGEFSLTETVSMQPVADYLKVRINGVEDINYLTLAIKSNDGWLNLKDVELKEYDLYANAADMDDPQKAIATRYALVPESFATSTTVTTTTQNITVIDGEWVVEKICGKNTGDGAYWGHAGHQHEKSCYTTKKVANGDYTITNTTSVKELENGVSMLKLNCGRLDETVVCHNENEYVFVVPAGILRSASAGDVDVYLGVNTDLTEIKAENMNKTWFVFDMSAYVDATDSSKNKTTGNVAAALKDGKSAIKLENYIHNVNGGKAVTYNPTGKFIIHNELDFLQYMNEYASKKVDAYVCGPNEDARNNEVAADYKFDFSTKHINELATSFKGQTEGDKEKMNKYVSDYIANGIPCIAEYSNSFEANGATFEAIKGLQSKNGMFGKLMAGARVENFILKNIKGAAAVEAPVYDPKAEENEAYAILASEVAADASIENIDIENASYANCILAAGDVADVKQIEMLANEVLPYVIYDFTLDQNWTVAPEKYLVNQLFVTTIAEEGEHNVITVAESADAKATYKMFGAISDDRDDDACVSVVINNESWWTNDTVADALEQKDKDGNGTGYAEILYAEQLKAAEADYNKIILARNMQMNGFDWEAAVVAEEIDGNGKTIYGITWSLEKDVLKGLEAGVAPFAAPVVKKLNVEGQTFNFITDGTNKNLLGKVYMPAKIAGLTLSATDVQDVKINNFVIFAKDAEDASASIFNDVKPYYQGIPSIGWAVVDSTDGLFKNIEVNVTSSNVKGEAGLINTITLDDNAESQVTNAKANVSAMEQTALDAIVAYDATKHNNVAGTPVFKLINNSGAARSIKFTECGAPALTYVQVENGDEDNKINVLNGNTLVGTYNCFFVK